MKKRLMACPLPALFLLPMPALGQGLQEGDLLGYHSKCNRKERIGHRKALC